VRSQKRKAHIRHSLESRRKLGHHHFGRQQRRGVAVGRLGRKEPPKLLKIRSFDERELYKMVARWSANTDFGNMRSEGVALGGAVCGEGMLAES
jgi:hypothetical protein